MKINNYTFGELRKWQTEFADILRELDCVVSVSFFWKDARPRCLVEVSEPYKENTDVIRDCYTLYVGRSDVKWFSIVYCGEGRNTLDEEWAYARYKEDLEWYSEWIQHVRGL